MDPVCHTLVGLTLGRAGLRERTPLAGPALIIGANLPDVDILAAWFGRTLEWRRGWTHGIVAVVLLPLLLTGTLLLWDKLARSRAPDRPRPGPLLWVAAIAVLSHPLLDLLNTYGVRLLMPFSGRWFYGDTLFIVDPWVWAVLTLGTLVAVRRGPRPARVALATVALYIVVMASGSVLGRAYLVREGIAEGGGAREVMVAPVPLVPWRREVVMRTPEGYRLGMMRLLPRPHLVGTLGDLPSDETTSWATAAAATPPGRRFLAWSRFPFFEQRDGAVRIGDVRYARPGGGSWASVLVGAVGPGGASR